MTSNEKIHDGVRELKTGAIYGTRSMGINFRPDEFKAIDDYIKAVRDTLSSTQTITRHSWVRALVLREIGYTETGQRGSDDDN